MLGFCGEVLALDVGEKHETKVNEHGPSVVLSIAMWPGRFGFCCGFFQCASPSNKTPFNAILCRGPVFPALVCLRVPT